MEASLRYTLLATTIMLSICLPAMASAQCVGGSISSELMNSGPHAGLFKYTVSINWDTEKGLSHVTLNCSFGECATAACGHTWEFDSPGGIGTGGDPGNCDFDFAGEFNCNGDASIGIDEPILKWDAIDDGCEAEKTGTGTLCFYTDVPPAMGDVPVVLVKNGQSICEDVLVGDCPLACPIPVQRTTWGAVRSLYN